MKSSRNLSLPKLPLKIDTGRGFSSSQINLHFQTNIHNTEMKFIAPRGNSLGKTQPKLNIKQGSFRNISSPHSSLFSWSKLSLQTAKENSEIKQRLSEYNNSQKSRRNAQENIMLGIAESNLTEKLKSQAYKINKLLSKKINLMTIEPLAEQTIILNSLEHYNGRIYCKSKSTPFLANIIMKEFTEGVIIFLSFKTSRPSITNYEKKINLTTEKTCIKFTEDNLNVYNFSHTWIYMSIYSETETQLKFHCNFGKGIFFFNIAKIQKSKICVALNPNEIIKSITKMKDIELALNLILSDSDLLRKCNNMAFQVKKKRLNKINAQLSKGLEFKMRRRHGSLPETEERKNARIEFKREKFNKISKLRKEIEQKDIMWKFLISHRQLIISKYVGISLLII